MKKYFLFVSVLVLLSCGGKDDPEVQNEFSRQVFLTSYADKFVIPDFKNATVKTAALMGEINLLDNASDLSKAQSLWREAYLAYLKVSLYNFGPAAEEVLTKSLVEEVATFPVNKTAISVKLISGDFGFTDFKRDTRGFLALEYLLFDEAVQSSPNWLSYLKEASNDVAQRIANSSNAWENFQSTFISNDGTAAGSSTSVMYNEFLKSFEALKNFKLGLPLGLRPGQTEALPMNVEAPFSKQNLLFLNQHFQTLKSFWIGTSGKGFRDYLMTVEGGPALVNSTELQVKEVEVAFEKVSESDFEAGELDGNVDLINLHTELQKLTRFFKSEMSSLLGIAITFSSGDGD
ncbi:MAG: putative lipoprotein [Arcticibacterium sp.]|jgi:predicted lipoprotein